MQFTTIPQPHGVLDQCIFCNTRAPEAGPYGWAGTAHLTNAGEMHTYVCKRCVAGLANAFGGWHSQEQVDAFEQTIAGLRGTRR